MQCLEGLLHIAMNGNMADWPSSIEDQNNADILTKTLKDWWTSPCYQQPINISRGAGWYYILEILIFKFKTNISDTSIAQSFVLLVQLYWVILRLLSTSVVQNIPISRPNDTISNLEWPINLFLASYTHTLLDLETFFALTTLEGWISMMSIYTHLSG